MAYDIGPKIGIEGEKEFRSAITNINTTMKTLGTEMNVVASQFDKNDNSVKSLTAKNEVLNKQIDAQKQKLDQLKAGLDASADKYGENDKVTQGWQQAVNQATAELNNMERQVKTNNNAMDDSGKKAKKAGADASESSKGWEKLSGGLSKVGQVAAKAVAALATAALGAATAVGGMTVKAAYAADDINTLAKQTGLSTEAIQKFKYASEQIDVPLETLTKSMAKNIKSMKGVQDGTKLSVDAYKTLGIEVLNADGSLRDGQTVYSEVIGALSKMKNETERDALAMQILGKSAQDLNPLILGGADSLKKLGDEAQAAGLILGQESLDNLNKLSDAMDTFKATASGSGNLFATAFAGPMAEGINTITGYMTELSVAFNDGGYAAVSDKLGKIIADIIAKINEVLPKILEFGLNIITKIIDGMSQNLPALVSGAIQILTMLVNSLLGMLPQLLKMGMEIVKELSLGIASALPALIPAVVDTMLSIVDTLIDNIDMLIDAAILIITALAEGLIEALPRLIDKIPEIIVKLVEAIANNLPKIIEAGISIIIALAGALITALPRLIKKIPEIISGIVNAFASYYSKITEIGTNIIEGIWDGIRSMISWLSDKISGFLGGIMKGIKKTLGISSPSKVFAGIGENMALGLGEGFASSMDKVSRQINNSVPTDITMTGEYRATAQLGEGIVNGLASVLGGLAGGAVGAGGPYIIQIPIDGKVVAQVIFDPLQAVAKQRGVALG